MPELADVEGFRRVLAQHAVGREIRHVHSPIPEILRNTSPQGLGRALDGHHFEEPRRHGKWLIAPVEGRLLVLHFGMTSELAWTDDAEDRDSHDAVLFETERGTLRYRTQRKFGGVWLARDDPAALEEITGALGPDAASIEVEAFVARLSGRRGQIKSALMDQSLIAGLGNELSDEILWRAGIAPDAAVGSLGEKDLVHLHERMREVLEGSIPHGRIPEQEGWLEAHRHDPEARCPRCGHALERREVSGRTGICCPSCQKRSDPSAA